MSQIDAYCMQPCICQALAATSSNVLSRSWRGLQQYLTSCRPTTPVHDPLNLPKFFSANRSLTDASSSSSKPAQAHQSTHLVRTFVFCSQLTHPMYDSASVAGFLNQMVCQRSAGDCSCKTHQQSIVLSTQHVHCTQNLKRLRQAPQPGAHSRYMKGYVGVCAPMSCQRTVMLTSGY